MSTDKQAGPQQAQDPIVQLSLPVSAVNFILGSLDANPLKAPVTQAASLMQEITNQARNQPVAVGEGIAPAQNRAARRARKAS